MPDDSNKLDPRTLENLCLAVLLLRTADGKVTWLIPKDVLQPWVYEQIPGAKGLEIPDLLK